MSTRDLDPHKDAPVSHVGAPVTSARAVVILAHGRNAAPPNILELAGRLDLPDVAYLAPAASGRTWYPLSFLVPREQNEPSLTSALGRLHALVHDVTALGVPLSRVVLGGFSQGACLATEYVWQHPARYGGLVAFSGGLIGPQGTTWQPSHANVLAGMSAFLGCSDVDSHVPKWRVEESAEVLRAMGAEVELRLYPGMGHLVNDDEIAHARTLIQRAMA
ncbi:MAG: dienelactone hydrolase family protein [Vicinamibacterales bacterium]